MITSEDFVARGAKDVAKRIKEKIGSVPKWKKFGSGLNLLAKYSSCDDKVAIIRMIVGDEAGRVSSVFRNMMKENAKNEEEG